MLRILSFILLIYVLFSCNNSIKKTQRSYLESHWKFKVKGDTALLTANVPGLVHIDLLNLGIIEDPFFGNNEEKLQWISEKEWIYSCQFSAESLLDYRHIDLCFDGLDTYAKVYLNDSLLFIADNMFRSWHSSVKTILRQGNNNIKIHFFNPDSINSQKAKLLPYSLPEVRGFSRKAPYHFGWDWGARFLTAGIWKNVYLEAWDNIKLENVQILQKQLDTNLAFLTAENEIYSEKEKQVQLEIIDSDTKGILSKELVLLKKGKYKYSVDFQITKPKLWWCNGLGEPNMYNLSISISDDNTIVDQINSSIGLRTIDLIQKKDSIGESFIFKINGKPVFIKGANYVPSEQFLTRVSKEDYEKIIESAIFSNMNMLRVWGGGVYESDIFYDLCDKNGILVWQDFMFAGTMYPGDSLFLENVENEAIDQIIRLRNHPSIALWCGNNEVDNGWKDWGWQEQFDYSESDSTELWTNYENLFHQLLPNLVSKYDSERAYWPSSPKFGWGHKENFTHGDSHYWGVWWGKESFDIFNHKVGRFMSEYGFQGIPDIKTIKSFAPDDELSLTSNAMKAHQKHPIGYEIIDEYLQRDYKRAEHFEDYIYLSQLLQAEGMTIAMEVHRRHKPYCMGTLYWQLNDSWPVTSWSSIDYFHRYKALHYFVKEAYKESIISTYINGENIEIHVVSDDQEDKQVRLKVRQIDFFGNEIYNESKQFNIIENSSTKLYDKQFQSFIQQQNSLLYIELWEGDILLDEDYFYFVKPKELDLPVSKLAYTIEEEAKQIIIKIKSDVLTKNIQISTNLEGVLSDNYFDLLAGKEKVIYFTSKQKGKLKIELKALNNIYNNKP